MQLTFDLPDYCDGCPLMQLEIQQKRVMVALNGERHETPCDVYCIHQLACATWHKIVRKQDND